MSFRRVGCIAYSSTTATHEDDGSGRRGPTREEQEAAKAAGTQQTDAEINAETQKLATEVCRRVGLTVPQTLVNSLESCKTFRDLLAG